MFTTEQIKPYILHPEPAVSNTALRYFEDSFLYENDPTLMSLVLQRLKQTDKPERHHWFYAYPFPQTEETVQELVEFLQSEKVHNDVHFQLCKILSHAEPQLLEPYQEFVDRIKTLQKSMLDKRRIANMNNQELIAAFETYLKDCYGKYYNEIDTSYGNNLVSELSLRRCISPEAVLEKLDPADDGYGAIYYTQLAGEMRLEAAIPVLSNFLGDDDDLLPGKAADALVRIGTPEVVKTVADQYFLAKGEFYRLFAAGVFGRIKLPVSEEAIQALLPAEEDLTYATILANGLCELGSGDSVRLVGPMVEEGYDDKLLNLEESLYAYCVISKTDHPMLSKWRQNIGAEEERQVKLQADLNRPATMLDMKSSLSGLVGSGNGPYVNANKVGRNDPCPCGSGKKYKKCCGK